MNKLVFGVKIDIQLFVNFAYKFILMRIHSFLAILFFTAFISCKDDDGAKLAADAKNTQKNEQLFATIDKAWVFNTPPPNAAVQSRIQNWAEWRLLMSELNQKPKSTIGAFQQKARALSVKVTALQNNIPSIFNKPAIISRIMTLTTKVKSLDLYINLSYIQDKKVVQLIPEINEELASLQSQMEEIIKKSEIQLEDGEADMLRSVRDSTAKVTPTPQAPINLQQQKPSSTRENSGIVPTLDPKQHR